VLIRLVYLFMVRVFGWLKTFAERRGHTSDQASGHRPRRNRTRRNRNSECNWDRPTSARKWESPGQDRYVARDSNPEPIF
jgi:hypothetical protein